MKDTIGFIGCGNMARAMIGGLIRSGNFKPENIYVWDPRAESLELMKKNFNLSVLKSNQEVARKSDYLVLAIKPYLYGQVMEEIKNNLKEGVIVISIAVGVSLADLKAGLGKDVKTVRSQPSTPAFVGESDSTLCPDQLVSADERKDLVKLFESFGKAEIISESLMDVVVGISSSAPVYTMLLIEAMADGGVLHGFPRDQAYRLSAQAVLGAAKLVLESRQHPGILKDQICTPGGTTIEAVRILEEKGFRHAVISAVDACAQKSLAMKNQS